MQDIAGFVDPFHAVALVPIGRCLMMLAFELPAFVRFRTSGLRQLTGKGGGWVWGLDSPCLLLVAAIVAGVWRFALPFSIISSVGAVVAGTSALALLTLVVVRGRWACRLHPYLGGTALVLALLAIGKQPVAAGLAGLLLLLAPGYELRLWSHIGVVGVWGRGSMGYAAEKEQEVLAWCLVLVGLCVWVLAVPPSIALPVWGIWAVWVVVSALVVTTELVFHTNELPPVRFRLGWADALERHAVRLTLGGATGTPGGGESAGGER